MAKRYTTIEFEDAGCRLAQVVRQKESILIEKLAYYPLPPATEENEQTTDKGNISERGAALKKALKKDKVKPGSVTLLLPKNLATTRLIMLPSTDPAEIAKMARYEAERHIPFNFERHSVSHHVVDEDELEGSTVLMAAADSAVYNDAIQTLTEAGFKIDRVDVSTFGLYNYYKLFRHRHPEQAQPSLSPESHTGAEQEHDDATGEPRDEKETQPKFSIPIINIGRNTTDIDIIQDNRLIFNRSCSVGLARLVNELRHHLPEDVLPDNSFLQQVDIMELEQSLTSILGGESAGKQPAGNADDEGEGEQADTGEQEQEPQIQIITSDNVESRVSHLAENVRQWLKRLIGEIRRTYEFAKREFDCYSAREVFITGEGILLKNIRHYININFGVETSILNPFDNFPSMTKNLSHSLYLPESYVPCLGSALSNCFEDSITINLIPDTYIRSTREQQKKANIITHGILALAILILAGVYIHQQITYRQRLLEWYTSYNKEFKPIVDEITDKEKKLGIIKKHIYDRHSALAILNEISGFEFIPDRVAITRFKYNDSDAEVVIDGHARSVPDLNTFLTELEKTQFFSYVDLTSQQKDDIRGRSPEIYSFKITCEIE